MAYQYVTIGPPGETLDDLGVRIKELAIAGTYVFVTSEAIENAVGDAPGRIRLYAERIAAMNGLKLEPEYDVVAGNVSEISKAQTKEDVHVFSVD